MSGRRPLSRASSRLRERLGRGQVYGLLTRKRWFSAALIKIRTALRPHHRIALVPARTLLTGFQALSVGSHHLVGALDSVRQVRRKLPLRQRPAPHLAGDDDLALRVDAVDLERVFRQIAPDARDSGEIAIRLAQSTASLRMG